MSDDFIPLNQSTPVQQKWQPRTNRHQRYQNLYQNGHRRGGRFNNWGNSPRNNSFVSNSSNTSYEQDCRNNIDAYLHPSMLQDPWASLQNNQAQQ